MRINTKVAVLAAAAATTGFGFVGAQADTYPTGIEGCVVGTFVDVPSVVPGVGGTYAESCTYAPTRPGGFVGAGTFSVKLNYTHTVLDSDPATPGNQTVITHYSKEVSDQCQGATLYGPAGSVGNPGQGAGDHFDGVTVYVGADDAGGAAAGNPFPTAADRGPTPCAKP